MKWILFVLLIIISVYSLTGCSIICPSVPKDYHDDTLIPLNKPVNNVLDAYDFSDKRVKEWGMLYTKLGMITIYFTGKQMQDQRGTVEYIFDADDGKDNYLAQVIVTVDMKSATSTSFDVSFDPRTNTKRNKDGYQEGWAAINSTDFSEWTLTLDEAFSIIYNRFGNNAFSQYENPKITLNCSSDKWIFYVTKENETIISTNGKFSITINPINKEIMETTGF